MLDLSHLGDRIREKRKKKMMTIKTLAQYTGLSAGYLSMLEQNKTSPNIDSLAKICEALDVNIAHILEGNRPGMRVIRKDEIRNEEYPDENMTVGIVDFKQNNCIYEYITIYPGDTKKKESYRHVCSEMCTVLAGVLMLDIEGETYELHPGDSAFIKGGEKHRIYNNNDVETISLWIYQKNSDGLL